MPFKSLSYIVLDDEYYRSIIKWYKIRENVELKQEWINYCYAELLEIVAIIRQISHVGTKFVITSPVRSALPKICTFNYREVIFNELQIKNNKFKFNFNVLNEQLRNPMVKAFLLCNSMKSPGKVMHSWAVNKKLLIYVIKIMLF
ncbi:hypothetical protein P344_06350 [Spiroplasma mirum ATCC 29335]|uniref:Uncharacterized protein n=1 Tax=Spiroplasma mirum ATCC 29335 TaxID=838561 RepID=W6AMM5_9MOLU|nr:MULTISPECIES: hypothetical protein [Spiroplasma]AHI58573.1 hypothetical protein P344_06350 [Spiroplasma mirum ATCC 29335]